MIIDLHKIRKTFKPLNYKGVCVLCLQRSNSTRDLCLPCEGDLPYLHPMQVVCRCCGVALTLPTLGTNRSAPHLKCGECLKNPPHFEQTIALMEYEHPIDAMIQALKLRHNFQFLNVFCSLLGHYLLEHYQHTPLPGALIAVPLHHSKLATRGFNQSQMMAHRLSRHLAIPALEKTCLRQHSGQRQSGLSAQQRRRNLVDAFKLTPQGVISLAQYPHVAIVDDVMTTGSTANELAKVLREGGVKRVDVICFARTGLAE